MATYTVEHIHTCYPEYLQDHHNRDGEYLVGIEVDGAITVQEVTDQLMSECLEAELPEGATNEHVEAAVMSCMDQIGAPDEPFDDSLEEDDGKGDDHPQAWFLLKWEA